ncbi:MAG TPA: hypothetical protein VKX16_03585, partial [Chloroflexota bacterium]|nr:hypothetical protein [Chloroflexota bacterium]
FPNGKVRVDPNLGPGSYQYFHVKVSGQPAMQVKHTISKGLSEINTFVEGNHRLFDVRIVVAHPPISPELRAGYNTITSTLTIPTH